MNVRALVFNHIISRTQNANAKKKEAAWNRGHIIPEYEMQNFNIGKKHRAWNRGHIIPECKIWNANIII